LEEIEHSDTVELEQDRFISLQSSRKWPKYVVDWSVRRRVGDSDFPLVGGTVEQMPPAEGMDLEAMWSDLRQRALAQAQAAIEGIPASTVSHKSKSLLGRLFGRQ
jgi:hypothetical protein